MGIFLIVLKIERREWASFT